VQKNEEQISDTNHKELVRTENDQNNRGITTKQNEEEQKAEAA
jgi:hypothetical protein